MTSIHRAAARRAAREAERRHRAPPPDPRRSGRTRVKGSGGVGRRSAKITVRVGIRPPWRYKPETIWWKATARPAMTAVKSVNRARNRVARASRKSNRRNR